MSYAKRMSQLPTTQIQQLVALSIVAALSFILGLAADSIGGRLGSRTTPIDPVAAAPASTELYDSGWAGGPGPQAAQQSEASAVRVPYDAGWELYDNGWAGGPGASGK